MSDLSRLDVPLVEKRSYDVCGGHRLTAGRSRPRAPPYCVIPKNIQLYADRLTACEKAA
jgi:hypothetical protein